MRIALLNLPYDNNYGGNLQRYALMKILQDMGHDVTHLNLRFNYHLPWYKKPYCYTKRLLMKYVIGRNVIINHEYYSRQKYENQCAITEPFYQKYIKHTEPIKDLKQLRKYLSFDAYVVGSDQVWRKRIAGKYLHSMFFDFLPDKINAKRIAYGVSLGVSENELNDKEIESLSRLYSRFDAVSVREDSALDLFEQYGWTKPKAIQVLDPTLLLKKEDYVKLIENSNTKPSNGNMFCYILDINEEKIRLVHEKAKNLHLVPFTLGLEDDKPVSIEQWLRSFADAKYVITDSYHGLLFSIIFNKPFHLIENEFRGNARFDSVMNKFDCSYIKTTPVWKSINSQIENERNNSFEFLCCQLNKNL